MIITNKEQLIQKCQRVSIFEANDIITKLIKELNGSSTPGVGLAANQIGINAAVCIVRLKEQIELVNPIIINSYDLKEFHHEGCLSFPTKNITTARYDEIQIVDDFHMEGLIFTGMEAVVVQHEIDHLNGIIMFDREIKIPGPNEACWCGSKKYKRCHAGRKIID